MQAATVTRCASCSYSRHAVNLNANRASRTPPCHASAVAHHLLPAPPCAAAGASLRQHACKPGAKCKLAEGHSQVCMQTSHQQLCHAKPGPQLRSCMPDICCLLVDALQLLRSAATWHARCPPGCPPVVCWLLYSPPYASMVLRLPACSPPALPVGAGMVCQASLTTQHWLGGEQQLTSQTPHHRRQQMHALSPSALHVPVS